MEVEQLIEFASRDRFRNRLALPSSAHCVGRCDSLMPTSEHYRQRAEECRRLAEKAQDVHERQVILRMAEQWDRLAEYKDELARRSTDAI
jgi:hypothetical protein